MKKQLAAVVMGLCAAVSSSFGGATLVFDDLGAGGGTSTSGSYAPGATITFGISLVYTGAPPSDLGGYSLFFQSLQSGVFVGGRFNVTAFNRATSLFTDAQNSTFPQAMTFGTTGADNQFDLGATLDSATAGQPAGTYFLGSISFVSTGAATPGTYTLQNVFAPIGQPNAGHGTVAVNKAGTQTVDIASTGYTVTIIPEPSTWSLLLLSAIGVAGIGAFRRRRVS